MRFLNILQGLVNEASQVLTYLHGEITAQILNNIILKTAVQSGKVMQDFESESFSMGAEHSQKVKAAPIENDYGSKDCVNLPLSTAVFRIIA